MSKLTKVDLDVLVSIRDGKAIAWGAAVSVALEYLRDHGLITDYMRQTTSITPSGLRALDMEGL